MQLATRAAKLKAPATLAINALALELAASGKEIISLSVGEPDFRTPEHIGQAGITAINSGFTKYTTVQGIPELRKAVAAYFQRYGADATFENILISNGAKQAIFNILMAVLNPGDEALMPTPCWVSYPEMIELTGAKPVPILAKAEKGFKVSVADLERHRTSKTRLCILNSPSNPTGVVYTQVEVDAMAEWAVKNSILLLSDEIYDQLVYDGIKHASFCAWWKKHPENFVIVNGVSKSFSMTGWRIGYLLGAKPLIRACNNLQGQITSSICSIAQKAAVAALSDDFAETEKMRIAFERRRNLVMGTISTWPDVLCPTPRGAFYVFPEVNKLYTKEVPDSESMCKFLLEKAGVALVPGEAFGDDHCVRISYATDDETLKTALNRISKALFNQ